MTDAQLLALFVARRDETAEVAFEALVERHGPMVFRVCFGVLRDEHAAEDAFQATFLVLARKARSLWVEASLDCWLHGVAHRVASKARSESMRRRRSERQIAEMAAKAAIPGDSCSDVGAVLSEEINRLPERYRAPLILCCLEAMSYEVAASRLGVTADAVRGRLARARERLRSRLTRRGIDLAGIPIVAQNRVGVVSTLRPGLMQATIQTAMRFSAGRLVNPGGISAAAISLSERVCRSMMLTRMKAVAGVLIFGAITAGAVVLAQPARGGRHQPELPATTRRPPQGVAASAGHLIIDWFPAELNMTKRKVTVDAARHCVNLAMVSVKRESRPNDGVVRLDLEQGKTYTVSAAGEAFMSDHTGSDADPFPGVILLYGADAEDGFATRQVVLAPGQSITFRTPWRIDPQADVYLMAFFLDIWPESPNRGSYTLTVTQPGDQGASWRIPHDAEMLGDSVSSVYMRSFLSSPYLKPVQGTEEGVNGPASSSPRHQDSKEAGTPRGRRGQP